MPTSNPAQRRALADQQVARLHRHSRALEAEGSYREAQEAVDAAADWDFWATYGIERSAYDQLTREEA